jgi:hypothetical protein
MDQSDHLMMREASVGKIYKLHKHFIAWPLSQENQESNKSIAIEEGRLMLFLGELKKRKETSIKLFLYEGEVLIVHSNKVWSILNEIK